MELLGFGSQSFSSLSLGNFAKFTGLMSRDFLEGQFRNKKYSQFQSSLYPIDIKKWIGLT